MDSTHFHKPITHIKNKQIRLCTSIRGPRQLRHSAGVKGFQEHMPMIAEDIGIIYERQIEYSDQNVNATFDGQQVFI